MFPALFPPTSEHPAWVSPAAIDRAVGLAIAGAVAFRAAGAGPVLLLVLLELVQFAAGIPGRITFCERSGGILPLGGDTFSPNMCDQFGVLVSGWPHLAALGVGAVLSRWLFSVDEAARGNRMLRGAGAFALASVAIGLVLGFALIEANGEPAASAAFMVLMYALAGAAAGVVLARASFVRTLVVAVVVAAPQLTMSWPLVVTQIQQPVSTEMAVALVVSSLAPVLGGLVILAARAYVRRRAAIAWLNSSSRASPGGRS